MPFLLSLQAMVDVAREVGADAVSHGCTGKGNDQAWYILSIQHEMRSVFHSLSD